MTRRFGKTTGRLNDVDVVPLTEEHLSRIWLLWKVQYGEEISAGSALPSGWNLRQAAIESTLKRRVKSDFAMVAKNRNETLGYMLFDVFPFHGEKTAFCPIIGHAAKSAYRGQIIERLYKSLSEKLVSSGILSHVITYFAHDKDLGTTVFELGFGSIVIDAFRGLDALQPRTNNANIVQADSTHIEAIEKLGEESRSYYAEAPLFLTREKHSHDYYLNLFDEDSAIFLAYSNDEAIGFMRIRRNKELDYLTLADTNTGRIDQIGAYIRQVHRNQGIGRSLLSKCIQWCKQHGIKRIHVDFESANLLGRPFWLKFFRATMCSARRTTYGDIAPAKQPRGCDNAI